MAEALNKNTLILEENGKLLNRLHRDLEVKKAVDKAVNNLSNPRVGN